MSDNPDSILSQTEREYLKKGQTKSYSETELRRRISEKSDTIDSRLQNMIDDLILMQKNDLLETNKKGETFNEIFHLENSIDQILATSMAKRDSGAYPDNTTHHVRKCKKTEEIGYVMGGFLHLLLSLAPEDRPWNEMMKGLLMFYIMNPNKRSDNQVERLEDMINPNIKRPATEIRTMGDVEDEYRYKFPRDKDLIPFTNRIIDVLHENDIPQSRILVQYIDSELYPLVSFGNIDRYTLDLIQELNKETELKEINNLCRTIKNDKSLLSNVWRGPSRINIIKKRFDPNTSNKSKNIASQLTKSTHDNLVTTALNKLSDRVENSKLWTEYPLFEETDEGLEFTPYGKLFAQYLNDDINFNHLHVFALSDKISNNNNTLINRLISDVLNQVSDAN
jgi:hypothetical protein